MTFAISSILFSVGVLWFWRTARSILADWRLPRVVCRICAAEIFPGGPLSREEVAGLCEDCESCAVGI